MINFLRNLNRIQEIVIVIIFAFGLFIFFSNQFFINTISDSINGSITITPSNFKFYFTLIFELIMFLFLSYFLKIRGWKIHDFKLRISFKNIGAGVLIILVISLLLNLIALIPFNLEETTDANIFTTNVKPTANLYLIIISSVLINPFYEEFFLIGYLGKWFEGRKTIILIIVSILIRLSFHTYLGLMGTIYVSVIGLVFILYYIKFKELTPIIISHSILNLIFYTR